MEILGIIVIFILVIMIVLEVRSNREAIRVYKRKVQDGITLAIVSSKKNEVNFQKMFNASQAVFSIISNDMAELREAIEELSPKKKIRVAKIIKTTKSKKVVKKSK